MKFGPSSSETEMCTLWMRFQSPPSRNPSGYILPGSGMDDWGFEVTTDSVPPYMPPTSRVGEWVFWSGMSMAVALLPALAAVLWWQA